MTINMAVLQAKFFPYSLCPGFIIDEPVHINGIMNNLELLISIHPFSGPVGACQLLISSPPHKQPSQPVEKHLWIRFTMRVADGFCSCQFCHKQLRSNQGIGCMPDDDIVLIFFNDLIEHPQTGKGSFGQTGNFIHPSSPFFDLFSVVIFFLLMDHKIKPKFGPVDFLIEIHDEIFHPAGVHCPYQVENSYRFGHPYLPGGDYRFFLYQSMARAIPFSKSN